jgi:hypothetical protein
MITCSSGFTRPSPAPAIFRKYRYHRSTSPQPGTPITLLVSLMLPLFNQTFGSGSTKMETPV